MTHLLRKARTLLSVHYALLFEMRAEIFLWMLSTLFPFIMMAVWVQAGEGGTFKLTSGQFAQYFAAVFIVRQLTMVWVIWEFEQEVLQGRLSPFLLQPIDPVWRHVATHIVERAVRLPFVVALLLVFFLLYPAARWAPAAADILLAAIMIALAFVLRFVIQYTFGLLAFWTERATSIEQLWFLIYIFLSGMVGPLDEYHPTARLIAHFTPFPYLVYYPTQVLLGREVDLVFCFGMLSAWIAGFLVINRLLWRVAIKRYSAMGA